MLIVRCVASFAIAICCSQFWQQSVYAQASTSDDDVELRFQDYEDKIQAILKTRLPEEKEFVTDVLQLVREGKLPERIVETSYKWALNKHPDSNYPFVYFERVLRIQANKLKIELPEFDYSVYRQRLDRRSSN
jgi:hypothetical protein